jgi:hypothetical protein
MQVYSWMKIPANEPPCPILFLYSKMDRIIRAASVKDYVEALRASDAASVAAGGEARLIRDHQFPLGQHVVCFWTAAVAYKAQVGAFIRQCLS